MTTLKVELFRVKCDFLTKKFCTIKLVFVHLRYIVAIKSIMSVQFEGCNDQE